MAPTQPARGSCSDDERSKPDRKKGGGNGPIDCRGIEQACFVGGESGEGVGLAASCVSVYVFSCCGVVKQSN